MFHFRVFFFSSRRRHTRLVSDWSSDVCSSDLARFICRRLLGRVGLIAARAADDRGEQHEQEREGQAGEPDEIGRASCRERVRSSEGGGWWQKRDSVHQGRKREYAAGWSYGGSY